MATFTSAAAFVQNIGEYGTKVKAAEPKALQAAALAATRDIRAEAAGFHIGRKKLGAGYAGVVGSRVEIVARNPGAWKIIEEGTKAHDISPRRRGRGGRGRRAALTIPGYGSGFAAVVHHKGARSSGKPWEKGVARAKVSGPRAFNEAIKKAL